MKVFEHEEIPLFQEDASGAFGLVFKTRLSAHQTVDEIVVRKLPSCGDFTEIQNELDKLDSVDHPNLVRVHGLIHFKEGVGLLVQPARGNRLSDVLYSLHSPSMAQRVQWIQQILSGIQALHEKHLVHGNLTAENIVFETDTSDVPMITDYGLCRFYERHIQGWTHCSHCLAPEVSSAELCSQEADVFALGLLLWQILSLQRLPLDSLPCLKYVPDCRQKVIISKCWNPNPLLRPELSEIAEVFRT